MKSDIHEYERKKSIPDLPSVVKLFVEIFIELDWKDMAFLLLVGLGIIM